MCHGEPRRRLGALATDTRGTAAIEFSLIAGFVIFALFNTIDFARYFWQKMEFENATQMAAQAAWKTCDTTHLPATTNCPGLNAAVTAAIHSSSLGSSVTLANGSPTEGYYCVNASSALVYVSDVSSKPANCSSVGNASGLPGDYIKVQTTYTFTPLFSGISLGSTLTSPIIDTSIMRLQ